MKKDQGKSSEAAVKPLTTGDGHYRRLFDEATEGICLADRETGIIQDCNQAFLHLTGYEREELIGKPQTMLHPAEDGHPAVTHNFALHRSEKQGEVLTDLLITKSGTVKEVEIKASSIELGGRQMLHGFFRDMTEELRGQRERETTLMLLRLLNDCNDTHELIRNLTSFLQNRSGCEAVGIRLREGDDFPYFETRGFSKEFLQVENSLCQRDLNGQILRDKLGRPLLGCMCGNILSGRFDPALPFFTAKGSFWTNCTTELLAHTSEKERQGRTRNRCNSAGYESVALIPLRHGDQILGLVQLNDHARGRFTPELISFLEYAAEHIAIALAERQAQAALEASEERYRGLFENMTEGYAYCRMLFENGCAQDWIYLAVNEAFETLTGLKNVAGKRVSEAIPGIRESDPELFAIYARVASTGKPEKFEMFVESLKMWFYISVYSPEREFFVAVFDVIDNRKRAEIALRKSEALFSKAFHGSPVAMTISSMRDQRIIDVNESFERQSGYLREEAVGRTAIELGILCDPQDAERANRLLVTEGKIKNLECMVRTQSGEHRIANYSTEIVEVAGESCVLTVAEDITERKCAVQSLQASEERFRQMFEHTSSGMVVYEAVEDGADFIIKEFNPAAERATKAKRSEVVGRGVLQFFPAIKDIGLFETFQRVWRTGIPEHLPSSLYRDERLAIWVENYVFKLPSGEVVAIFDDITSQKIAETDLRNSEVWHRSLIELGVSMYIVVDAKQQILYSSPLVEKILGWNPEEIFLKTVFELVASSDMETAARFFAELLQKPGRKKRMIAHIRCKDGSVKAIEIFGVNLLDEPAVQGIVLGSHDVTDQIQARERIDSLRAELTHAARLASMGALATGIAHEINQPLSTTAIWAEVAMREIRENLTGDKQKALLALARIDAAMERCGNIVNRMKDFARKSGPRVSAISIAPTIEEVRLLLEHQLRVSSVTLSVEVDCTLPAIFADGTQVQQVFMNLILNAIEALESIEPPARRVEIRAKEGDGIVEVAVSDNGCSIPPDQLEIIFHPFHSTKPEGMGLGLSICESIIQWHGGQIWATRNRERGTTITFTLPIVKEAKQHAARNNNLYRR